VRVHIFLFVPGNIILTLYRAGWGTLYQGTLLLVCTGYIKGDTDASMLDGVKIVQKKVNNVVSKIGLESKQIFFRGTILRVLPGQQKVSKKCPLLTAKHFQTQLTKKVREI
jgi:hypothetical protein